MTLVALVALETFGLHTKVDNSYLLLNSFVFLSRFLSPDIANWPSLIQSEFETELLSFIVIYFNKNIENSETVHKIG